MYEVTHEVTHEVVETVNTDHNHMDITNEDIRARAFEIMYANVVSVEQALAIAVASLNAEAAELAIQEDTYKATKEVTTHNHLEEHDDFIQREEDEAYHASNEEWYRKPYAPVY